MKKRILIPAIALLFGVLALPSLLSAQERGSLSGVVTDGETGEPIPGVTVLVISQKGAGAATDAEGKFLINGVLPGVHDISLTYLTYKGDTLRGVEIEAGKQAAVNASLYENENGVEGREIVKKGTRSNKSEEGALNLRKNALQVTEVTSAEEITASGASNAGDAVQRQTGVSIVGGKNIVVRGTPERYSSTQLNGINLPSPEPEKKTVPFDLFPAGMIDNITTIKTFTPDNPGDFAGALVKIKTKDFPKHFIFNAGIGGGMNSQVQGADGLDYAGGASDWIGIDDGTRALPSGTEPGRRFSSTEQAALLGRFDNTVWRPETASLPMNSSFNLTLGNSFGSSTPIGLLLSTSYASNYSFKDGLERQPLLALSGDGSHELRYDYTVREAEQSVLWGGLVNLSVGLSETSTVGFKGVLNHSADDEALLVTGDFNSSTTGQVRRTQMRFTERTIAGAQLLGEHQTNLLSRDSKVEWRAALSLASRSEPDNRQTAYLRNDENDAYRYNGNFGSGNGRFFSDLQDVESNVGFDWTAPLYFGEDLESDTRLKFGSTARFRNREFTARRFLFGPGTTFDADVLALDPEELFTPENVAAGFISFDDNTLGNDKYNADERIVAGYAMVEAPLADKLRFIGGARVEWWTMELTPFNLLTNQSLTALTADQSVVDILPSANLIYNVAKDMNLRGSFSQTLARPEFRELAPFRFDDYKQSTFGNPGLERTRIMNYDLRWEWYTRPGELLSVSGFYKNFTNPIEQFYLLGGSDIQVEPVNASGANTFGVEVEARKGLDEVADFLTNFSFGLNFTIVKSTVTFDENSPVTIYNGFGLAETPVSALTNLERPLQGQSPYTINSLIGYSNSTLGTDATLLFNVFGERLAIVGTNNYPDVYEQPQPTLDFTLQQKLPAGLKLSLKAKNILDTETRFTQEFVGKNSEVIETERYFSGRSLSLGISFSLDQLRIQNATRTE
ncbi:MAG: TonB-dependent receptor [Ignavibacteriae bacterium]|nr:TonB-dependent receptor [Ignavibacteriota bacterium]MCB9216531.1 TonB-dependent receptor [Ignavibacteria bacterium]